jgi:hypothetical protein
MESLIILMAKHMTVVAVAETIDEHDTRIRRVLEHYVAEAGSFRTESLCLKKRNITA